MFKKIIITIAGEITLFLLLLLFLRIGLLQWEDSTLYPPTYSEFGFQSVRKGYTGEQVERLAGPPLDIYVDSDDSLVRLERQEALRRGPLPKCETWCYTTMGRGNSCAYHVRMLYFDRHGRVVGRRVCFEGD